MKRVKWIILDEGITSDGIENFELEMQEDYHNLGAYDTKVGRTKNGYIIYVSKLDYKGAVGQYRKILRRLM